MNHCVKGKTTAIYILLVLLVMLNSCGHADETVIVGDNNGAITGAWAIIPDDANKPPIYFESDGLGRITEHGLFDQRSPAGTYAVMKTGLVSITLSTTSTDLTISGVMINSASASFSYNSGATTGSIRKVTDTSLLSSGLTGSLTETNGSGLTYSVDLTVAADGSVTPGTIESATVSTGKAYNASGTYMIFLHTNAVGLPGAYNQILIWGTDLTALKYQVSTTALSGTGSLIHSP
jgi:hypothetical protein